MLVCVFSAKMATGLHYRQFISLFLFLLFFCGVSFTVKRPVGLEIKCGEVNVRITVKRQFFEERNIPFKPEYLRLGANSTQQQSCGPKGLSESEMVISAGLRDCGTKSRESIGELTKQNRLDFPKLGSQRQDKSFRQRENTRLQRRTVHDEWLVYSNQLVMFPALVPTSTNSLIVRGVNTVVPVHCHYRRQQTVHGEPLTPTWLPMISTAGVFGLLHFSLRTMADGCASLRSSSVYQQGEAVFLEASVEAPLHPPLTLYVDQCVATLRPDPLSLPSYKFISKHGCLMDSVMPGSLSKFLPREQDHRLCFSVQAFHFTQESTEQMFISCHLKATLKENSYSHLNKACYFHRPTFSWRTTEGDTALCECCDSDDCFRQTGEENSDHAGHTPQPGTVKRHEADTTVGPLHTIPRSYWTGRLSVSH